MASHMTTPKKTKILTKTINLRMGSYKIEIVEEDYIEIVIKIELDRQAEGFEQEDQQTL